nr:hypothetical protein [Nitrosomonas nitrosa]
MCSKPYCHADCPGSRPPGQLCRHVLHGSLAAQSGRAVVGSLQESCERIRIGAATVASIAGISGTAGISGVSRVSDVAKIAEMLVDHLTVVELSYVLSAQTVHMVAPNLPNRSSIKGMDVTATHEPDRLARGCVEIVGHRPKPTHPRVRHRSLSSGLERDGR